MKYEVPQMAKVLAESYGVIAYQEQVMRLANELAGVTMGEADLLRKAMGKKNAAVMQAQRERFMKGAIERGVPEKKATKVFDLMEFFAGYGFNKSHSTAYAYLAYQTAYLKANYPWHFAAALLTIEAQNTEKLAMYLAEARDRQIPVLPPDINQSQLRFSVERGVGVRFGLIAIKGIGETAIQAILAVRDEMGGRIPSLHALCERVDLRVVNKRVFEALVKSDLPPGFLYDWTGESKEFKDAWKEFLVVLVLALIRAVQVFDEIFVLTGGGPGSATLFIVQFIYQTGFAEQIHLYGLAAAASLALAGFLVLLTLAQLRLSRAGELGQKGR